jgi:TetR/AcrR family acrAB operon transcriptional repressor
MRRTKEEAAITRQRLLEAALAVFSEKGYAAATLEEIAREADLTRGAIYWHFGDKAGLYNALLETYSNGAGDVMQQAALEGGSLLEILRRIFVGLLMAVEEDDKLRAVIELSLFKTGSIPELEPGRQERLEAGTTLLQTITSGMQAGIDSGDLRSDMEAIDMARAFLSFQNGAIQLYLTDPKNYPLRKQADTMAEIFLNGVIRGVIHG